MRSNLLLIALCLLAVSAASSEAFACSVCAVSKEESRNAYYITTALLSLLPLGMMGGMIFYLVKKSR